MASLGLVAGWRLGIVSISIVHALNYQDAAAGIALPDHALQVRTIRNRHLEWRQAGEEVGAGVIAVSGAKPWRRVDSVMVLGSMNCRR